MQRKMRMKPALVVGVLGGGLMLAGDVPAQVLGGGSFGSFGQTQFGNSFGQSPFGTPFGQSQLGQSQLGQSQFAQGQFGNPFGQSQFGQPLGQQQSQFGPRGQQGGVFSMGGATTLASGQTVRVAAFCTDLLSDAPDGKTQFTGGSSAQVASAEGPAVTLASALGSGSLTLRGRDDSFDPVRRDGSLALDLYLTNTGPAPVRIGLAPGTSVTPTGQGAQAMPEGSDRLFAVAAQRRLSLSNTMQYAIWAARGSTAEEVEQTNMLKLPGMEISRVQGLLNESGIRQSFDRNRGLYAAKYDEAVEKLGDKAEKLQGSTVVPLGGRSTVELVRAGEKAYATVKVHQSRGEFFYRAEMKDAANGKLQVKLLHLVTGRPMRGASGGTLTVTSTTPAVKTAG
jgi:hypothetical protein